VESFDATDSVNTVLFEIPVSPMLFMNDPSNNTYYMTPLANYAERFRYWRGGINFLFQANVSQFTAYRITFAWIPNEYDFHAINGDDYGNYARLTVDVTGDTTVMFNIPYLANTPYLVVPTPEMVLTGSTAMNCMNGKIIATITSPIVTSSSLDQTVTYFHMWAAGDSSFHCVYPQAMIPDYRDLDSYPPPAKVEPHVGVANKMMREYFEVDAQPLIPAKMITIAKMVNPDAPISWTEYFHRPTMVYNSTLTIPMGNRQASMTIDPWDPLNYQTIAPLRRFLKTFGQRRGGWRIFMVFYNMDPSYIYTITAENQTQDASNVLAPDFEFNLTSGAQIIQSNQRYTLMSEIPFYGIVPCVNPIFEVEYREVPCLKVRVFTNKDTTAALVLSYSLSVSPSDDFNVGCVLPPNPLHQI
jgi:hypothetical protein